MADPSIGEQVARAQLATHLAFIEAAEPIEQIAEAAALSNDETRVLARIGLANYFAGALLLPYRQFLEAAETLRYDIDLVCRRSGVGYETAAHRLSTLQRPGARGVPFRVDRAGNISTQLAQIPDGRKCLWVAHTVSRTNGGYATPAKTFAIGLGCDLQHGDRLVCADRLDLTNPAAFVPIGPGCKLCERKSCPQRALPAIGKPLEVDPYRSRFTRYGVKATVATGRRP